MKIQIKCPSCFFKYEGEMDETKDEMSCVCPRCGTPFTFRAPEKEEKTVKEHSEPEGDEGRTIIENLRVCEECGTTFDKALFSCPSCGCPIDGYSFCPDCNNLISNKSKICPNCGSPVNGYTYCPDCDTLIAPGNSSCPNCGCPIEMQVVPKDILPEISQNAKNVFSEIKPVKEYKNTSTMTQEALQKDIPFTTIGEPNSISQTDTTGQSTTEAQIPGLPIMGPESSEPVSKVSASDKPNHFPIDVADMNISETSEQGDDTEERDNSEMNEQEPSINETMQETETAESDSVSLESPIDNQEDRKEETNELKESLPEFKIPDSDNGENASNKKKTIFIVSIIGIILIIVMFFAFAKCSRHKTRPIVNGISDSVRVDSMKVAKGNAVPLWLVGQWYGEFKDKSMGKFSVSICIDKYGKWSQKITHKKGNEESDVGKVILYSPKQFMVLYNRDKSKTSFKVNEKRKTFSLGNNYWLAKQ